MKCITTASLFFISSHTIESLRWWSKRGIISHYHAWNFRLFSIENNWKASHSKNPNKISREKSFIYLIKNVLGVKHSIECRKILLKVGTIFTPWHWPQPTVYLFSLSRSPYRRQFVALTLFSLGCLHNLLVHSCWCEFNVFAYLTQR